MLRTALLFLILGTGLVPLVSAEKHIVLIAGEVQPVDRRGHHDYLGGIAVMRDALRQTTGITTTLVSDGWPADTTVMQTADALVLYSDGGGKQAWLADTARVDLMDALVARGVGVVLIHQAVEPSAPHLERTLRWIGASYNGKNSTRGHWDSTHSSFPTHPITAGVTPWTCKDGWLTHLRFSEPLSATTPLLWSSQAQGGQPTPGLSDVVAWAHERPTGGRSFAFTGLDAHDAWKLAGVRQLMINGILWSAGCVIPDNGAPCALSDAAIDQLVTPRVDGKALFKK